MEAPLAEKGIIVGNVFNKYESKNPVVRWIMSHFYANFFELFDQVPHSSVHEVGCGEGYLTKTIRSRYPSLRLTASDFSSMIVEKAKQIVADPTVRFLTCDIYQGITNETAELVVASEVLEHLTQPGKALAALQGLSNPYCLLSVPREPIWRILNIVRGKYVMDFGNTPGHLQHWTAASFLNLVSGYFDVLAVRTPLPFTIALCRKRERCS